MENYVVEFTGGGDDFDKNHSSQVIVAEDITSNNNEDAPITELDKDDSWTLFAAKCVTTPIAATFSSMSLPLVIITLERRFAPNANLTVDEKLYKTLPPFLALAFFRTWLLWYRIGQRINGKPDRLVAVKDGAIDTPSVVRAAMFANIAAFCNGLLLMMLVMQDSRPEVACGAGLFVGTLNYIVDLLTDISDAIRKYSESKDKQGIQIKPLFKQQLIQCLFNQHIEKFGIVLREIFPVITGIIRSRATADVLDELFKPSVGLQLLKVILGIVTYEACAFYARYEVLQLRDNLELSNLPNFNPENYLTQSTRKPMRLIGKMASGQLLIDGFDKLKLSPANRVYAAYLFATIGFSSLIYTIFVAYLFSTDKQMLANDREGLLINYFLSDSEALDVSRTAIYFVIAMSITLGAAASLSQTGTLYKYLGNQDQVARDDQIAPSDEENPPSIQLS